MQSRATSSGREIRIAQCHAVNTPVFCKQLGAKPYNQTGRIYLEDKKGGDWLEWEKELRVREYPKL